MANTVADDMWSFEHNYRARLPHCWADAQPTPRPAPQLVFFNPTLAKELQLTSLDPQDPTVAQLFAGNHLPEGAKPLAQAYAGHQFGQLSPQLGDGRAVLLGEVRDHNNQLHDIAFKGSGRTPFSRGGDGAAAIGPMLREVLMSEFLAALGVPTTRCLAVVTTGESVQRTQTFPGAVLTRTAASHLRIGTLEFFAIRDHQDIVRDLADYTIERHYPELNEHPHPYVALFEAVATSQAALIAQWMGLGFIHGVMNTDNVALSGETLDFGPCAFMDHYDPATVFSSIDHQGRYAYRNQPAITAWNLTRFAETLIPILAEDSGELAQLAGILENFMDLYQHAWVRVLRQKLGLPDGELSDGAVHTLATDLLGLMAEHKSDFTGTWWALTDTAHGNSAAIWSVLPKTEHTESWVTQWQHALGDLPSAAARMQAKNPRLTPRNHLIEAALAAATNGDYTLFERALTACQNPWLTGAEWADYATAAPAEFTEKYQTFCGT